MSKGGVSFSNLAEAGENIGMHSLGVRLNFRALAEDITLPCVAHWRQKHFVVVYKIGRNSVYVSDPAIGLLKYSIKEFIDGWIDREADMESSEGNVLELKPTPLFYEDTSEQTGGSFGFKFLFWYFNPYKKYMLQLFFGLVFGSLVQLILPFLTQSVVDYGINYQNINFIYLMLLAQVVLFISQSSVELIRGWILLHMTSRINISLISDFLLKLMRLPIAFFDSKNTGDIIQRIYDHTRIQSFLSSTSLNTLFSIFNVLIFGSVLAFYNLQIFIIFFSGSILYIGWTILFLKKRAELDYKRFSQSADNQNSLMQLITGMQEIKLNGSERRRRWEWESIQVRLLKISMKGLTLSQTQNTGSSFLHQLQNILITFISAKSVISGDLTLGMMLSVQYIIGQLNYPINSFIGFIQSAQDAKISLERLSEIHNKKNEEDLGEDVATELPVDKTIALHNVSYRYGGKNSPTILDSLEFQIPHGKTTAIVGASGCGKTTLLKLLLRFYEPVEGSISVGDTSLKDVSIKTWRKACSCVMQDGFHFDDTILRNITESDSESELDKERLSRAVKVARIDEFIQELPLGFNTRIGSKGTNISGGQKQRLLIARSIYKDPQYIFFDEATSALDSTNEALIMENLKQTSVGKTVVIAAHRLSTIMGADQIIVLDKGRIVEIGNHQTLVERKGSYYALIQSQMQSTSTE